MTFENELGMADADTLVSQLVRAGRADGPSQAALEAAPAAVAALLAMPAAAAGVASATSAAAVQAGKVAASPLALLKWIGVGALASSSTLVLAQATHRGDRAQPTIAPVSVAAPRARPAAATPVAQLAPQPALPTAPPATALPVVASAPRADVAREVASLDAARQALVEGNTGAALRILSKLEQLPARALAPEATVLRVRALLARGDTVEAKRVVERFCVVAPSSPQAGILRTLIADSEIQAAPSRL